MADEFRTLAGVPEILKLNQQTVRNWIDAGKLPALCIGRRVRVKCSDFDALVEASYASPRNPVKPAWSGWDGEVQGPVEPAS